MIIEAMRRIEAAATRAEEAGRAAELAAAAALAAAESWRVAATIAVDDPIVAQYHRARCHWGAPTLERYLDPEGLELARGCAARGRDAVIAYLHGKIGGRDGAVDIAAQVATAEVGIVDGPPGPWHQLWALLKERES